jgi:hypothetical protein
VAFTAGQPAVADVIERYPGGNLAIVSPGTVMTLFLSKKGKRGRSAFESEPVYFGDNTW